MTDDRPVLFVTNYAPTFRHGAFARLHASEDVRFALIGGGVRHGGDLASDAAPHFPVAAVTQRAVLRLAASGRFRAVVAGLSGRLAPAAAYLGARRARVPFVLWATMWAHPRTPAHLVSYAPVRFLYAHADAIATYGPHVSDYVRARGARGPVLEAPQSVDNDFWGVQVPGRRLGAFQALFVGRLQIEKGVEVLADAWEQARRPDSVLVAAGEGPLRARLEALAVLPGALPAAEVRALLAGSDVVVVPSIPTRAFREPWGLTVNEAFNQGVPVIASDAVGAAAGGLVRHEQTGLIVPAGDAAALAAAIERLRSDPRLRTRLGAAGRSAAAGHSHTAWAAGVSHALAAVGASRGGSVS